MFFLVHFDNYGSKETDQLMFDLSGIPNGTILTSSKHIVTNGTDKWIIWIDKDIIDRNYQACNNFSKMKGIKSFTHLDVNDLSPYDKHWVNDTKILKYIFEKYL